MLRFLLICIFLTSFTTFAGQHGSGGNICIAQDDKRFKAFDEIKFPERASGVHLPGSEVLLGRKLNVYPILTYMLEGDLLSSLPSENAKKKILNLANNDEKLSRVLITYFDLMKDVYVSKYDFKVYAEVGKYSSLLCKPGSLRSVILTRPNGAILISSSLWRKLSMASQEIILIHETLRIAQLFTDWFGVTNDELEELTMKLFSEDLHGFITHPFYKKFKKTVTRIGDISRDKLQQEIDLKDQRFSESLIIDSGEEAFKLQLSILEKAALKGEAAAEILKNESRKLTDLKRNSYYLEHVANDLFWQFGINGLEY